MGNSRRARRPQLQFSERKLLLAVGDILAVFLACLIALFVWTLVARYRFTLDFILPQSPWFFALAVLWFALASANDFYDLRIAANRNHTLQRLLIITAQTWIVYMVVYFLSPPRELPRLFIIYYGVVSFALITGWRFFRPFLLGWVSEPRRTLILGTDWTAGTIIEALREHTPDYRVLGLIGQSDEVGKVLYGVPVLGTAADLPNFISRDQVSELILTEANKLKGETFQNVMDAYEAGVTLITMPLLYERVTGRVPVEHLSDDWGVIFLPIKNVQALFDPYPLIKRGFDIAVALVGLTIFAVLLPFIALALYLDSRGSIFFTQERLGMHGYVFRLYKLRSMIPDAEAATGAVFAQKGDPRVTRIGRFLRRSRLDEVPQLWNVLRGDMSLIGPRPERPEHVERLTEKIPFYRTRLIMRPGLTGWAQVRYPYGSNDEDALVKLQYDLYYIRNQSVLLDVNILLRTVYRVVSLSGV
ncbi:MAG: sugar transferase [Anaerolineae bacterium]|nr:sugar transferase [Anaerolineae bacterium]